MAEQEESAKEVGAQRVEEEAQNGAEVAEDGGETRAAQGEEEELEEDASMAAEENQDDSLVEGRSESNPGVQHSEEGDEHDGSETDPQQESTQAPVEFKKGVKVEVEYEGDWWDAHIVEEGEDGQVRVHYVGGTEDEDEWVDVNGGRLRPAARAEVVWARIPNAPSAPAVLLQGSLRNPYCKKLQIYHFVDHATYSVRREQLTAFTPETIPKRNSDKKLAAAIDIAREVFTTGEMPENLAPSEPQLDAAGAAGAYPHIAKGSKGIKKASVHTAQERRRQAMRKLGLLPPLGVDPDGMHA